MRLALSDALPGPALLGSALPRPALLGSALLGPALPGAALPGAALLGAALLGAGCAKPQEPAPASAGTRIHFTDATARSGIDMTITSGRSPSTQLLEVKGGGLALVDFDADGDLDLFVPNGATLDDPARGPGARLFRNDGGLRFRDVTRETGLEFHRWGQGVAVGDVDGDGFDDVFVACHGPDALLLNREGRSFAESGAEGSPDDPRWGTGCALGDLDGDGDLDLYVANYVDFDPAHPPPPTTFRGQTVFAGPLDLPAQPDSLWENLGGGRFREVSRESGILAVAPGPGLGAVILDFDGDGKQDVLVGDDSTPKRLFRNVGGMRFEDAGMRCGLAVNGDGAAQATMGIAIADVNGDGAPDVFTTNFSDDTNTLHVSVPGTSGARALWEDRTAQYGLAAVSRPFLGWGTWFADFDQDGDEDLVVFDGHVYPQADVGSMDSTYRQVPLLFERKGPRFERAAAESAGAWLAGTHCDRSAVFGDLDQDGDVDVVVGEQNGRVRVLENDGARGHWLVVELADLRPGSGNRRGLGAQVRLRSPAGTQTRWIFSGGSYQAACSQEAHFGLASAEPVSLEIVWPDGTRQALAGIAVDRRLRVKYGA